MRRGIIWLLAVNIDKRLVGFPRGVQAIGELVQFGGTLLRVLRALRGACAFLEDLCGLAPVPRVPNARIAETKVGQVAQECI